MLPPQTSRTEPVVTKDAAAEDERTATDHQLNESPVNTSFSSSSVVDDDEKDTQSPRQRQNDKTPEENALTRQLLGLPARTTSPRKRKSSTVIRRNGSSSQFSDSRSGSKTSATTSERQRKKETAAAAGGKTATQKSVLRSKIAFFLFLVTVAAVAGGKIVE